MRILLSCISFQNFTGSEIYFYELSQGLLELGHTVDIYAHYIGKPLKSKCNNINFISKNDIKTNKYDFVLFSHGLVIWDTIKYANSENFINIIHSEVLDLEKPIINKKINRYVGVRPSIIETFNNINCELIYNPFDFKRFNKKKFIKTNNKKNIVLFPGSLDYLRINPINYLLNLSTKQNFELIHVGRNDYDINHKNFKSYKPTWNMEKFYYDCDIVSGIFLGRTCIEGLLCGKRVLQFDVDKNGNIKRIYNHVEEDLSKFDRVKVARQMLNEY